MSKASAMSLATGQPTNNVNPSLITGAMNDVPRETNGTSPGLAPTDPPVNTGIDSDRFAKLAKKEAEIQKERNEWKVTAAKERAEIEELKKKLKDPYDKIQAFQALKAKDPVAALKEIDFTETDIFNFLANQEKPKEPTIEEIAKAAAGEELGKYKEEQAKIANDAQRAREQGLITQYSTQIGDAIKANPDKYEYANYYGESAKELAMEFATENVKLNGELLTPDQIAEAVEEYYEEQDKAMSVIKKRAPRTAEIEASKEAPFTRTPVRTRTLSPQAGQPAAAPMKTLTNKVTATAASTITRRETHEQKRERLINALRTGTYVPPKR